MKPQERIRNFVIISHVDHGKSTLADRFLELTGTVVPRAMRPQYLDQMELERERGITIKMQPVRMQYKLKAKNEELKSDDGKTFNFELFTLNLIDTPGHADFAYEVSRALAAVEGAILLVDATQGVQAQTLSTLDLARAAGLIVIPVVNKIDLPAARVEETRDEIADITGCRREDVLRISAKRGDGIAALLDAVIARVAPPGSRGAARDPGAGRALIFDSHFDEYRGVIAHVRVFDGSFRAREPVRMIAARRSAESIEVGYFSPSPVPSSELAAGEIGYLATGLKDPDAVRVGDTVVAADGQAARGERAAEGDALPGYREPQPVVFASVYPEDADDYAKLADSLKKMKLNDAAIVFEAERTASLGRGFRMGFLGMLHMEIAGERLKREHGLSLVFVSPSVAYRIRRRDGEEETAYSASGLPEPALIGEIAEPWARLEVAVPQRFLGAVVEILRRTRGAFAGERSLGGGRLLVAYEAPLADILVDFSDDLKRVTSGYGSFRYEPIGYRPGDLVRLDVLIAGTLEPAIAQIVPRDRAYRMGRALIFRMKELLPRQLFAVSLQAAVEGRIVARETLSALGKNVTGHLYGGDRTRKMKLWAKQKRGKRRLSATAERVVIPPEVFLALLKREAA